MTINEIAAELTKMDTTLDKIIPDVLALSKTYGDGYDKLADALIDLRDDIQVARDKAIVLANESEEDE